MHSFKNITINVPDQDDVAPLRKVVSGLHQHLATLIPNIYPSVPNAKGLFDVAADEIPSCHKTLKVLSNIVTKIQLLIHHYDTYKNHSPSLIEKAEIMATCFQLLSSLRHDQAILFTGDTFAPLPAITEEWHYQLGIGLIEALVILKSNQPFDFILPLIKNSDTIARLIAKIFPDFQYDRIATTIAKSSTLCAHYESIFVSQLADSDYTHHIAKKTAEYLNAMFDVTAEYATNITKKPTHAYPAQMILDENLSAQIKLDHIAQSYTSLPNDLPYGPGGELFQAKLRLEEQKNIYLHHLFQDEEKQKQSLEEHKSEYASRIRTNYMAIATKMRVQSNMLAQHQSEIHTISLLFEQVADENRLLAERIELARVIKEQYEKLTLLLENDIETLKTSQETAQKELNAEFLSTDDVIDVSLRKEFNTIYERITSEFETCISAIYSELQRVSENIARANEALAACAMQQILDPLLQHRNGSDAEIQDALSSITIQIGIKQDNIEQLQSKIQLLSKASLYFEEQVHYHEELVTETEKSIENLSVFVASTLKTIETTIQRDNLDTLNQELSLAKQEFAKISKIWWKRHGVAERFEALPGEIELLTSTIQAKEDNIAYLRSQHRSRSLWLNKDKKDLRSIKKYLARCQQLAQRTTLCKQTMDHRLDTAQKELDNLKARQLMLINASRIFILNQEIAQIAEDIKVNKIGLNDSYSSLSLTFEQIIDIYNQSHRLESNHQISSLFELLQTIRTDIERLPNDDFSQSVIILLREKENELHQHQVTLQRIAGDLRQTADKSASLIAKQLQNSINAIAIAFEQELNPSVSKLATTYKIIAKHTQRLWYSCDDLTTLFRGIASKITASKSTVVSLEDDLQKKILLTQAMADPTDLEAILNLKSLRETTQQLLTRYQHLEQTLSATVDSTTNELHFCDHLSGISQHYATLLDAYEKYRNYKYWLKDLFSDEDKMKRSNYIRELKIALHEYEYLNYRQDELNQLIQKGIDTFPVGFFSSKNQEKNLHDILVSLKNAVNMPNEQVTSYNLISQDKERVLTEIDKHHPLTISPR